MNLFTIKRFNQYMCAFSGKSIYTWRKLEHEIRQKEGKEFMMNIPIGGAGSER